MRVLRISIVFLILACLARCSDDDQKLTGTIKVQLMNDLVDPMGNIKIFSLGVESPIHTVPMPSSTEVVIGNYSVRSETSGVIIQVLPEKTITIKYDTKGVGHIE